MITRWLFLAIVQVILMIIHVLFSPIICLFIRHGMLPWWLKVFQTPDALAIGDLSFHQREMAWTNKLPRWLGNYICGIAWAIRNPAYGFADMAGFIIDNPYGYKTTRENSQPEIDVGEGSAVEGCVYRTIYNGDGLKYFEYRKVKKWFFGDVYFFVQLGWSIPTVVYINGERRHLCVYIRPFASTK